MALSNNQKRFCQEYLKCGMNGTKAYLKAYKSCKKMETASVNASRLLRNANIQAYIQELQSKVEEKAVVSIEDVINELTVIAFGDRTKLVRAVENYVTDEKGKKITETIKTLDVVATDELDENSKKLISGYKNTQAGIQVESYDKVKALELLGKYFGMFKEQVEIKNPEATQILKSINNQLENK